MKHKHEYNFAKIIHQNIDKSRVLELNFERRDYLLLYCKFCGEILIKRINIKGIYE